MMSTCPANKPLLLPSKNEFSNKSLTALRPDGSALNVERVCPF